MTLIDLLYENYNYYINIAFKVTKRRELAEESLQSLAVKLIKVTDTIINNKAYLAQAVYNHALNTRTTNKKYLLNFSTRERVFSQAIFIEEDFIKSFIENKLRENIGMLPIKQRTAIRKWYGISCNENRKPAGLNYDTNKANVREAIISLRKRIKRDDYFIASTYKPTFLDNLIYD